MARGEADPLVAEAGGTLQLVARGEVPFPVRWERVPQLVAGIVLRRGVTRRGVIHLAARRVLHLVARRVLYLVARRVLHLAARRGGPPAYGKGRGGGTSWQGRGPPPSGKGPFGKKCSSHSCDNGGGSPTP